MSNLTIYEIEGADNDIFCTFNGLPVHIASMGGYIPNKLRDRKLLRQMQRLVGGLPYKSDVTLNLQAIEAETREGYQYIENPMIREALNEVLRDDENYNYFRQYPIRFRLYFMSFVEKARKGFYSYARRGETEEWILVASPRNPIDIDEFNLPLPSINIHLLDGYGYSRLELLD